MRLIKMLGLAAVAVAAVMAVVGATSAMAEPTALCLEDSATLTCPAAQQKGLVHLVSPAGTPGLLLSSLVNVECSVLYHGTALLNASNEYLGNPLVFHGTFTYSSCETFSGSPCTVTQVSASALLEVLKIGSEKSETKGSGEVLVKCGSFIHCVYNGTGLKGAGEGSLLSGLGKIEEQTVNKVSGSLCPNTSKLDLTLESLATEPIYIRN